MSAVKSAMVNCIQHGKTHLNIDTEKFKVFCRVCRDAGDANKYLEVLNQTQFMDEDSDDVLDFEIECDKHSAAKGKFYCDDHTVFICKVCFVGEHRGCNSNLLSNTSTNFKKNIKKFAEMMNKFEPKIAESTKVVTDLEGKINEIRDGSEKKLNGLVSNITKASARKNEKFMEEYKLIYDGIDEDIYDVTHRLGNLQGKLDTLITELIDVRENFNKYENGFEACNYKQMNAKSFIEANKIFKDSRYLIGSKVENSIKAASEKTKNFEEEAQKILKKIKVHRASVLNSINTGISSFTLRIRRFTKFSKTGINYFKTSSLKFSANSPVSIVGFSVCGLFSEENMKNILEVKDPNNSSNNSKAFDSMNLKEENTNNIINIIEKTLPFKFSIKEYVNGENLSKANELISENFVLKEIKNPIDPTMIYYLNKSINISPEKTYIVSIVNSSKDVYLDLWSGEVSKYFLNSMTQGLRCNTSSIKFDFNPPEGIESDFNEFNSGILSDFIFSHKE